MNRELMHHRKLSKEATGLAVVVLIASLTTFGLTLLWYAHH